MYEARGHQPFVEPTSRDEAVNRLQAIKFEIADIQAQLAARGQTTTDGRVLTADEYDEWRRRAKAAAYWRVREQMQLKEWLRKHDAASGRRGDGVSLTTETAIVAVYDALRAFVRHAKAQDVRIAELESQLRAGGVQAA